MRMILIKQKSMSLSDFQITSQLSTNVFKVRRLKDECIYALKTIKLDNKPQKQIQNAINQVRILASLRHPNVISYKEAFYDANSHCLCIIMQYADGGDLLKKIFSHQKKGSHFSQEYIWTVFIQLVKAISAIHQLKITHRDIKSSNVLLTSTGIVKLGNFNVSVVLGKGMMCNSQAGTPYYASPQVFKDEQYNSKSDMWSLGCILYQLLHLKPPFRARDLDVLAQKVVRGYYGKIDTNYSNQLATMISYLLNTNPYERYSAKQILKDHYVKQRMKTGKNVESLETSSLLKTIRPSKNMVYLTQRLPKPNYQPIRYRSYFQLKDHDPPHKIYGSSMQQLPQFSKSLNKSLNLSSGRTSMSPKRQGRKSQFGNLEWLPAIQNKRSQRLY